MQVGKLIRIDGLPNPEHLIDYLAMTYVEYLDGMQRPQWYVLRHLTIDRIEEGAGARSHFKWRRQPIFDVIQEQAGSMNMEVRFLTDLGTMTTKEFIAAFAESERLKML